MVTMSHHVVQRTTKNSGLPASLRFRMYGMFRNDYWVLHHAASPRHIMMMKVSYVFSSNIRYYAGHELLILRSSMVHSMLTVNNATR